MQPPSPGCGPSAGAAATGTAAAPTAAAAAPAEGQPSTTAAASFCFSFCKEAEKQRELNGMRHNDFSRYRQYCSRRAARLRAALDLRCGKHRYQQKPLPSPIRDIRVLLLVQTCAERGWSLGMQLKEENAAAAFINPRVRAHALRRFAKAVAHARLLERLCSSKVPVSSLLCSGNKSKQQEGSSTKQQDASRSVGTEGVGGAGGPAAGTAVTEVEEGTGAEEQQQQDAKEKERQQEQQQEIQLCDEKTCLDAHAYRLSLEAALLQEKEVWGAAAEVLQQLQQAYIHLRRVSSTREDEEQLFKRLLKGVEPQLRLCAFHSGDVFAAVVAADRRPAAGKGPAAPALPFLPGTAAPSDRLPSSSAAAAATTAAAGAAAAGGGGTAGGVLPTPTWRGEQLHVAADRPRAALAAAAAELRETLLFADAAGEEQLEELRIEETAAANKEGKRKLQVEEKLLQFTEAEIETVMETYGKLSSSFRRCVELLHAVLLKRPEESAGLVAAEGYCLDVVRCLDVERDLLLLLRFLLSMRRFEEEPSHVLLQVGSSRKQQQLLAVPRGETGERHASLLLQALGRMMQEDSVDEQQLGLMRHWQRIAKDARALCLVAMHASLNRMPEAYVLAATLCSRTKPYACQSHVSSDDLHTRLDIFFSALQRLITPLAQRFEARALAAVVSEETAAAAKSESAAAAAGCEGLDTAVALLGEGEKQGNLFFQTAGGMREKRKLFKAKKDTHTAASALQESTARYLLPPSESIPCKPLLFDLAIAAYQPPEALAAAVAAAEKEEKVANEGARGVRSFVKSLFWKK